MGTLRDAAVYDESGNIILLPRERAVGTDIPHTARSDAADVPRDVIAVPLAATIPALCDRIHRASAMLLQESALQYQMSGRDVLRAMRMTASVCERGARAVWGLLLEPVWIPGRNREPKQWSRGALFLVDTVRFGGTFAGIFAVLFLALNYQSFTQILQANLHPLDDIAVGDRGDAGMDAMLREKLQRIPTLATAGDAAGALASLLPSVGPPEHRLIIPRLDLNVPIIVPATDALLRENWTQLETDIQTSLQDGVVHYPGTARPGQAGNFFITGHSSYYPWAAGRFKSVFARLHDLRPGDEYWVFYGGDRHRYRIEGVREVRPSDTSVLDQPLAERLSTLMTCTPVGTTLRRFIVSAREIDPITGNVLAVGEHEVRSASSPQLNVNALPI